MKIITISGLPLIAMQDVMVSKRLFDLGVPERTGVAWQNICQSLRSFFVGRGVLTHWPYPVIYGGPGGSAADQIIAGMSDKLMPQLRDARSWSIFGNMHRYCHSTWNSLDRIVVHASKLGGSFPMVHTLLHEIARHHLYQIHDIDITVQSNVDPSKAIHALVRSWIGDLPTKSMVEDGSAIHRAIDLLTNRGEHNA